MADTAPNSATLRGDVLERIAARFTPMPPNGIAPPDDRDAVQLRIGTLIADTSWPEISELTGVGNAKGDPDAIGAAFPAIQEAARRRHGLAKRLMIRVWEEPGRVERLVDRLRPGGLHRPSTDWLVWGENGGRWREEP